LAGFGNVADKVRLRAADSEFIGRLVRGYQNAHLHAAEPGKVERFQHLADEFARLFPERADQLSVGDVAPYAHDVDLLAPVFANYDIIQAYGIGPIHPVIAGARPLIAFEHGTLRDFIRGDVYWHRLTALGYRKADHVFITNGDCIEHARWLGCESVSPMLHPVNVKEHEIRDEAGIAELRRKYAASVLLFCPIRHDWSVKGTDVHLRALPILRKRFGDGVKMVLSPWGQQIEESRRLIAESGCGGNVAWLERPLCRRDLIRHLQAADVVLDQMALPHFGATAPQALAAGTPVVMSYVPASTEWLVREPAPILAAFAPQEVADRVVLALDPEWRAAFKVRAREWMHTHHHDRTMIEEHIRIYRRVVDGGAGGYRSPARSRSDVSQWERASRMAPIMNDDELLRQRYETFALSGDVTTTACDYHLRDLEIEFGLEHIRDRDVVLDVGCGPGVALRSYARRRLIEAHGIDYAEAMVDFAAHRNREEAPDLDIRISRASVLELPYPNEMFDVVTSHRCLMALLDWDKQQAALREIARVLKPGGTLVLMEGTIDGLARLNAWRVRFGLPEIDATGRDRLLTLKFSEPALLSFVAPIFELTRVQRWGMYYFLTRIVQPLLVAPDRPRYDHPLNAVAKEIARHIPDLQELGHLVGFALRKRMAPG
jgi:ubiquinone/menaquinone biosynthesis C-methylase UbiE/glycosyltransferase involved in cell wall biosynthesis